MAVTRIQNAVRAQQHRGRFHIQATNEAISRIQSYWRRFCAVRYWQKNRAAAICLQSATRTRLCRIQYHRTKSERQRVYIASMYIQAIWCKFCAVVRWRITRKAVIRLQAALRRYQQRTQYQLLLYLKVRQINATRIQMFWRSSYALRLLQKQRNDILVPHQTAIEVIQPTRLGSINDNEATILKSIESLEFLSEDDDWSRLRETVIPSADVPVCRRLQLQVGAESVRSEETLDSGEISLLVPNNENAMVPCASLSPVVVSSTVRPIYSCDETEGTIVTELDDALPSVMRHVNATADSAVRFRSDFIPNVGECLLIGAKETEGVQKTAGIALIDSTRAVQRIFRGYRHRKEVQRQNDAASRICMFYILWKIKLLLLKLQCGLVLLRRGVCGSLPNSITFCLSQINSCLRSSYCFLVTRRGLTSDVAMHIGFIWGLAVAQVNESVAKVIQRFVRAAKAREALSRRKRAVRCLQRSARLFLVIRRTNNTGTPHPSIRTIRRAVTLIQACWRGNSFRKHRSDVGERLELSTSNDVSDNNSEQKHSDDQFAKMNNTRSECQFEKGVEILRGFFEEAKKHQRQEVTDWFLHRLEMRSETAAKQLLLSGSQCNVDNH